MLLRFTDLVYELVLVDGDAWTRLGEQQAMAIAQRRKRGCQQVEMFVVAALSGREFWDRTGNLQIRRQ